MSGTREGGLAAAIKNKRKYGDDFYAKIGSKGGSKGAKDGTVKGFAAMSYEKRTAAGRKGGVISKRPPNRR